MAWLFGKGKKKEKKPQTPTIEQNSENLSKTIEDIKKKIEYEDKKAQQELQKAIAFKKQGNDKKAKECLKRKKIIDMNNEKLDKMRLNLENQQLQIQSAETTAKVFEAYKQNNQVMKDQFKGYDVDQIQDTLDDMADQQQSFNEITDAIAGANFGPDIDEDEIDDELAALDVDAEDDAVAAPAQPAQQQVAAQPMMTQPMAAAPAASNRDDEEIGNLMAGFS